MEKVILDPKVVAGVWTGRMDHRPWKEFIWHLGTLKLQIHFQHPLHRSGADGGSSRLTMRMEQVGLWTEVIIGVAQTEPVPWAGKYITRLHGIHTAVLT